MTFFYYAQFVSLTAYWSVVLECSGYVQKQKLKWLCIDSENKSHFNVKSHYSLHLSRHRGYRITNNNSHILRAQGSSPHVSWLTSEVPAFKLKPETHKQSNNKKARERKERGARSTQLKQPQVSELQRLLFLFFFFFKLSSLWKEIIVSPTM